HIPVSPTTWPPELTLRAVLHGQGATSPRSDITPFCQRNAWCDWDPDRSARPTTKPESLIQFASEALPPKVPKSVRLPSSQRNPWCVAFPAKLELPTTCPR